MAKDDLLAQGTDVSHSLEERLQEGNVGILADTLHFETLSMHEFSGTVLSPTRVYEAVMAKENSYHISIATRKVVEGVTAGELRTRRQEYVSTTVEQLFLELANAVGDRVPGPHVVLIDPRKHNNQASMVESAQRMHRTFRTQGVPQDSIIVSIPATEEGIRAAQVLQDEGILTNLYLVTSLIHAAACAEAKTAAISISVGPLLAKYEKNYKTYYKDLTQHPGVDAIRTILKYFELNGIRTKVLGAAFRTMEEIGHFSEFDAVCVSAEQANRLRWSKAPIITLDSQDDLRVELRAKQAKYPTDLLTRPGGFSTWFSRDSRNLTNDLLRDALDRMAGQMRMIEMIVEQEIDIQASWKRPQIWKTLERMRFKIEGDPGYCWTFPGEVISSRRPKRTKKKTTSGVLREVKLTPELDSAALNQDVDEVF